MTDAFTRIERHADELDQLAHDIFATLGKERGAVNHPLGIRAAEIASGLRDDLAASPLPTPSGRQEELVQRR